MGLFDFLKKKDKSTEIKLENPVGFPSLIDFFVHIKEDQILDLSRPGIRNSIELINILIKRTLLSNLKADYERILMDIFIHENNGKSFIIGADGTTLYRFTDLIHEMSLHYIFDSAGNDSLIVQSKSQAFKWSNIYGGFKDSYGHMGYLPNRFQVLDDESEQFEGMLMDICLHLENLGSFYKIMYGQEKLDGIFPIDFSVVEKAASNNFAKKLLENKKYIAELESEISNLKSEISDLI